MGRCVNFYQHGNPGILRKSCDILGFLRYFQHACDIFNKLATILAISGNTQLRVPLSGKCHLSMYCNLFSDIESEQYQLKYVDCVFLHPIHPTIRVIRLYL